jgi:hypothetical protein
VAGGALWIGRTNTGQVIRVYDWPYWWGWGYWGWLGYWGWGYDFGYWDFGWWKYGRYIYVEQPVQWVTGQGSNIPNSDYIPPKVVTPFFVRSELFFNNCIDLHWEIVSTGSIKYEIDWGDGTPKTTTYNKTASHCYAPLGNSTPIIIRAIDDVTGDYDDYQFNCSITNPFGAIPSPILDMVQTPNIPSIPNDDDMMLLNQRLLDALKSFEKYPDTIPPIDMEAYGELGTYEELLNLFSGASGWSTLPNWSFNINYPCVPGQTQSKMIWSMPSGIVNASGTLKLTVEVAVVPYRATFNINSLNFEQVPTQPINGTIGLEVNQFSLSHPLTSGINQAPISRIVFIRGKVTHTSGTNYGESEWSALQVYEFGVHLSGTPRLVQTQISQNQTSKNWGVWANWIPVENARLYHVYMEYTDSSGANSMYLGMTQDTTMSAVISSSQFPAYDAGKGIIVRIVAVGGELESTSDTSGPMRP